MAREWVLLVEVDTNDGDMVREEVKLKGPEDLEPYKDLIDMIESQNGRFPIGDQGDAYKEIYQKLGVDEEHLEDFQERFLPYPEYGFHTIDKMELIQREIFIRERLI
jgi:hypothetical protein